MPVILKNNVDSVLAQAVNASETAMVVATGEGTKFPALAAGEYFYATLVSAQGTREIVKVTGKSGDTLAIQRGQEGTTANGFSTGSRVEMRVTAASITDLVDEHDQAAEISIADAGGYYTSDNVEGALQEVGGVFNPTGSSLIGYTQGGAGSVTRTVQSRLRDFVSVKDFGAVGDGVTDDTAAIQAADTAAFASGRALSFGGSTYVIKSPLTVSAPWVGVPSKTIIKVPLDFAYSTGAADPIRYSAITNKNCSTAYSDLTADSVFISGITFQDEGGVNGLDTLALANVRAGRIADCVFTATTASVRTPLDLFACVKDVTVERCKILNLTQNATAGGGMWVRNITSNGALAANVTENIQVLDCYFEITTLDEAFAVYGVSGMSRNVRVSRCTFNGSVSSPVRHGNLVTAFPLGSTTNAAVQDVVFSECRFESNNFLNHVFRAGQTADSARVCKDIRVENCYFKASLPAAGTSHVARNIPCVGGNVTFVNNIVDADGSANPITSGVLAFDLAANTTVIGNISQGFSGCGVVDACITKSITGTSAQDCTRVSNCVFSSALSGIVNTGTARYEVINNRVEVTATSGAIFGVIFNSIASSAPFGEIIGNSISLNNAAATAIRVAGGGAGNTRVCGNRAEGTGKTVSGTQLKEIQGNNWYGTLDSMRAAGYLDFDHNFATPIGTFAAALTHTAGATRYLLGFIKIANAGVGADWVSVFAENANN